MPLAPRTTVRGQGPNYLATRRAAYENIQLTLDHLRPTLNGRAFFKHVRSLGGKAPQFSYPVPAPHPRYRIPFWNLAPGDRVRVIDRAMSAPSTLHGRLGTVAHVDRLYNRVFLKERVFKRLELRDVPASLQGEGRPDQLEVEVHRGILYRDLQLVIGKYDLDVNDGRATILGQTPTDGVTEKSRQLVASGLKTMNRRWDARQLRFLWDRVPKHVRAIKDDGTLEPWLVPVPRDAEHSPACPKRVPWSHEERDSEGHPIEGTIAKPGPPPHSKLFDTLPAAALRPTWQPPDLATLFASRPGDTASLRRAMSEYLPGYSEFGNRNAQAKRRRLANVRLRYTLRRRLRAQRYGRIREAAEMPKKRGWFGPNRQWAIRPPSKRRARMRAEGKDPDKVFGRATGEKKYEPVNGLAWPK